MKTFIWVSVVLATLLVHPSLFAQPERNVAKDSVWATRQFIFTDIAGFPLSHTHSGSWQPNQSLRVGYGRDIGYMLELRVFAEYTTFDFDTHDGLSYQDYSPGQRHDFAIYPAIVAFRFVEIALGGYYTIQDKVYHHSVFSPQLGIDPAVKKFGIYLHYAANGSIHIAGPVNISLGMYLRDDLQDGMYFGGRAGVKWEI